jgi:hypothetical protein
VGQDKKDIIFERSESNESSPEKDRRTQRKKLTIESRNNKPNLTFADDDQKETMTKPMDMGRENKSPYFRNDIK